MTDTRTSLLSKEDLELIESIGFPLEPRPDLASELADGRLVFSVKGIQFYATAFSRVGMSVDLSSLRTLKDLRREEFWGTGALCVEADVELRREFDAGRIPAQRREVVRSYLDGSIAKFMAAAEHYEFCNAAGGNVIPVGFGNRAAKIRGR